MSLKTVENLRKWIEVCENAGMGVPEQVHQFDAYSRLLESEVARLTQAIAAKEAELAMAFRVVDSHKEREKNAVRIGCENITRAEKAESQLALAMGVVEAARSIDDYEPLGLALAAFDQARGGEEED